VGVLKGIVFRGTQEGETLSFGGCIAYNRESFFNAGGENENFISWSGEDWERVYRFKELGYKVERVAGILYHLDHYIGSNSSTANPDYISSMNELKKVQKLKGAELKKYVSTWHWLN
jgi:predicted glycosyltransferase involved in capsule biosynthesis